MGIYRRVLASSLQMFVNNEFYIDIFLRILLRSFSVLICIVNFTNEKYISAKISILLGNPDNSIILKFMILVSKHEIYTSRVTNKSVSVKRIVHGLKYLI